MSKVMIEMEMPKSCNECRFVEEEYGTVHSSRITCKLTEISFPKFPAGDEKAYCVCRHRTCPLQEVKEDYNAKHKGI